MACQNNCNTTCKTETKCGGNGNYIIIIVLYILLAIILGASMF
jgi:hypothetical protein